MMDWNAAIKAMKLGKHVQRASESGRKLVGHSDGVPIYECGMEPCFLAHAWSDDQRPVRVFCGSRSKTLFVPESEHTDATDWMIVEP
jgi:hypothetical protein